jgi:hypothetical protein
MKTLKLLVAVLMLVSLASTRGEETNSSAFSLNVGIGYSSMYVDQSGTKFNGAVWVPSATVTHNGSGVYVSEVDYLGINGGKSDELQHYLGWSGKVAGLDFDGGIGYYDYYRLFHGRAGNVWSVYGKASRDFEIVKKVCSVPLVVTPYVSGEIDDPDKGSDFGGGWMTTIGVKSTVDCGTVKLFCDAALTYENGTYDYDVTTTFQYKLGLDWDVWGVKVTPSVTFSAPSAEDRQTSVFGGVNVSHSFF